MTVTLDTEASLEAMFDAAVEFTWVNRFCAQTRRTRGRTLRMWRTWCADSNLDQTRVTFEHAVRWLMQCARPAGDPEAALSYQYAKRVLMVAVEQHQRFAENYLICGHDAEPACLTREQTEDLCESFKRLLRVAHTPIDPAEYADVQRVLDHVPAPVQREVSRWAMIRLAVDLHLTPDQLAGIRLSDLRHRGPVTTFMARSLTGSALSVKRIQCNHSDRPDGLPAELTCVRCAVRRTECAALAAGSATLFSDQPPARIRAELRRAASTSESMSWADDLLTWTGVLRGHGRREELTKLSVALGRKRSDWLFANAAMAVVSTTGLRMTHLATVRRGDVLVAEDRAIITYTERKRRYQRELLPTTSMDALKHLTDWLECLDAHPGTEADTLVFTSQAGSVEELRGRVNRQIRRRADELGVNGFTYAQCREMFRHIAAQSLTDASIARAMHHRSVMPLVARSLAPGIGWFRAAHQGSPRRRLRRVTVRGAAAEIVDAGNQQTGTVEAYEREWHHFVDWCAQYELPAERAAPPLVLTYLHSRYPDLALSTVRNIISAIGYGLDEEKDGDDDHTFAPKSSLLASYCQAVKNTLGPDRGLRMPAAVLDEHVEAAMTYRRAVRAAEQMSNHRAQAAAVIVAAYAFGGALDSAGLARIRNSIRLTLHPERAELTWIRGDERRSVFVSDDTDPTGYRILKGAAGSGRNPFLGERAAAARVSQSHTVARLVRDAVAAAQRRADGHRHIATRRATLDAICAAALEGGTLAVNAPADESTPQILTWLRDHRFIQRVHGTGRWKLVTVPPEPITGLALDEVVSSVVEYLDGTGIDADDKAVLMALTNAIRQEGVMPAQVTLQRLEAETGIHYQTARKVLDRYPQVVTAYPGVRRSLTYIVRRPDADPDVLAQAQAVQEAAENYTWTAQQDQERSVLMRLLAYGVATGRLQLPADTQVIRGIAGVGDDWAAISRSLARSGWLTYKHKGWVLSSPGDVKRRDTRPSTIQGRLVTAALTAAAVDPMSLRGGPERDWLLANLVPGLAEHLRDNALVCVGHFHGRRGTDLIRLDVADVSITATGLTMLMGRHKTGIEGERPLELDVPHLPLAEGECAARCPACALDAHLDSLRRRGNDKGPLFPSARRRRKHTSLGNRRLQRSTVREIVVRVFEGVPGVDGAVLGARSLRRGRATTMAAAGRSSADIARHIGHADLKHTLRYDASTVTAQL